MGAISMNLPAIFMPAGPMLRGHWRDQTLGSGSDVWKYWAEKRAGNITEKQWLEIEDGIARSPGHCMTMGTASTMTSAAEALGFTLPGAASIPAADSRHGRMAAETGRRIVDMVWEDLKPRDILSPASVDNAITTVLALGGSTNAVVHMIAVARRAGVMLSLDRFDALARSTPLIANIRPAGKYLMEDFFYAGGLRGLLAEITDLLTLDARTVNGRTLGENIAGAEVFDHDVILPRDKPLVANGSLAVLHGNLAPDGAVIKPAAAEARLLKHSGPAVVFTDYNDMAARIDDPALNVTADSVLVLQNADRWVRRGCPSGGNCRSRRRFWSRAYATWFAFPMRG
jgi:dihydroxy-acid dehydratase